MLEFICFDSQAAGKTYAYCWNTWKTYIKREFWAGILNYIWVDTLSCSKCLPHPSRSIAGLSVWKLPSFLRYFDWNHVFDCNYKFSVLKMNFLLNIEYWHLFLSQSLISKVVICNTLVEYSAKSSFLIYQSYSQPIMNKVFNFNKLKKRNPWIFHKIVFDHLEIPRPKTKTPRNSTLFFLGYPWKFNFVFN